MARPSEAASMLSLGFRLVLAGALALFATPLHAVVAATPAATPKPDARSLALAQATTLLRAGRYDAARTAMRAFLAKHPGDRGAELLLGVAAAFLGDNDAAVAAFDLAGTIPQRYAPLASKTYSDAAVDALKAKDNAKAVALANKSLGLQKNVNGLFLRGTAYGNAQRYPEAIADLEAAKAKATEGHADAATMNAIDGSLATSYIFGGQFDKGLALVQALKGRDPGNTRMDDALAAYYNQQAIAAMNAGDRDGAVAMLEKAATTLPSRAVALYVQGANVLSQGTSVDWPRVKAEADKALALDSNDARANYVAGIALANSGNRPAAIPFLQKAKANAGTDAALGADIDAALSKLAK